MTRRPPVAERSIRFWRDPVLGRAGTELLAGEGRRFGPLIRNEMIVAVVTGGELQFRIGGRTRTASAGRTIVVPAGEAFAGDSVHGWSWRVFYPDRDTLAAEAPGQSAGPSPRGPQPAAPDESGAFARRLITLHRAIERDTDNPLARQQAFADAIAVVLANVVLPPGWWQSPGRGSLPIRRALACVGRRYCDPDLTVAELAQAAGYSPYHFMRSFRNTIGLTAHAYIVQHRLHAARALLAGGMPAAEAALAVGFADQSHLIRQFKACHGVTPGQYADGCRRRSEHHPSAPGTRLVRGLPG